MLKIEEIKKRKKKVKNYNDEGIIQEWRLKIIA